jgi:hypothetical protein
MGVVAHTSAIIVVPGSTLRSKVRPLSKITNTKRAGGIVQVIEPRKHKALSLTPSIIKKKKKSEGAK